MDLTPAELRHGIRGTLNALKLCVSAFEMPLETSEKLEFLSDIEASAEKLIVLLEQFASCPVSTSDAAAAAASAGNRSMDVPISANVR
jgi:hypothetical protein